MRPGPLDRTLAELGRMWSGHLNFLSEATTVASGRLSVNPGYFHLAVDRQVHGCGIAAGLLRHAMELTVAASDTIAVRMLVVSALHPAAAGFYERFGLSRSPTNPLDLMITVADIEPSMST